MSWRRFCALYANLSPRSATFRNYDRIARKQGASNANAERTAWDALTSLSKPARKAEPSADSLRG